MKTDVNTDAVIVVRIPIPEKSAETVAAMLLPVVASAIDRDGWVGKVSASVAHKDAETIGTEIVSPEWTMNYRERKT